MKCGYMFAHATHEKMNKHGKPLNLSDAAVCVLVCMCAQCI